MKSFTAPLALLACLYAGLPVGGLRDPLLWTAVAAAVWLTAMAFPAPVAFGPSFKFWYLWLAWACLSSLTCDQPLHSLYAFSRWLTVIAYFRLAAAHWTDRDSRLWLAGLALSAVILGLGTILVAGTVHPMTGLLPPYYNYTVFVEAAFFAAALGALGHRDGSPGRARWVLWGVMIWAFTLIIKARSRGGLAAISVSGIIWMLRRGLGKWLLWASLALAAAAVLAPPRLTAHIVKSDLAAWFKRPQIWVAAVRVAADHPLLGEGPGNFAAGFLRHNFPKSWATNYGFATEHAHSELLEIAAETGWLGLVLFLLALRGELKIKNAASNTPMQEAGLCAAAAMGTQCLIDNMLHMPALAMLFFSALACLQTPAKPPGPPEGIASGRGPWRGICLSGLVVTLAAFFPQWLVGRAWNLSQRDVDPARRLEFIQQAARIFPADYYLRESLARAWMELHPPQPAMALKQLQQACRLNPTNALYPVMHAELALAQGAGREVLALLNRGITLEPNFLGARMARAELWAKIGNKQAARREYGEIIRRRAYLQDMSLYSNYDRTIVSCDLRRLAALSSLVKSTEKSSPQQKLRPPWGGEVPTPSPTGRALVPLEGAK